MHVHSCISYIAGLKSGQQVAPQITDRPICTRWPKK